MRTRRCAQHVVRLDAGRLGLRRVVERIVDELKISHDPINVDGADVFVRQPTQYASAGDCRVSMLTILEGRQFRVRVPPGPPISEGRTSHTVLSDQLRIPKVRSAKRHSNIRRPKRLTRRRRGM